MLFEQQELLIKNIIEKQKDNDIIHWGICGLFDGYKYALLNKDDNEWKIYIKQYEIFFDNEMDIMEFFSYQIGTFMEYAMFIQNIKLKTEKTHLKKFLKMVIKNNSILCINFFKIYFHHELKYWIVSNVSGDRKREFLKNENNVWEYLSKKCRRN